jgi:myo-inositol 2-dehydrogenase/D-chiro-inositol 1-dehydrogenase
VAIKAAGAKLVTVYDVAESAAAEVASQYGAVAAASLDEAIGHPEVEGVVIATSTPTHVELTLRVVDAGKMALCEKPLAPTYAECVHCIEQLGDRVGKVFLAFNRRFDPGHRGVWDRIAEGQIGAIEQLTITCRDPHPPPLDYIPVSGGLFRDMMIHDLDMVRWFLAEEPVLLYAQGGCIIDPEIGRLGDIDSAMVTMRTASNRLAVIVNSRRAAFGFDQRVEAFGSEGMLISDNLPATGIKRFGGVGQSMALDRWRTFYLERYGDSYRNEIEAFVTCVEQSRDAPVTARDGLFASYLAEAATYSYANNVPVALNDRAEIDWT